MTGLALVAHLMAKDWRAMRWWFVVAWLASASLAVEKLSLDPPLPLLFGLTLFLGVGVLIVLIVVQSALFLLDPPLGSTAFWLTRPIPRSTLLAAKLALWLVALVVPCVFLELAPMALLGLDLVALDYTLAAAEGLLWCLALGPALLVVALAPERPATRMALALVAGTVLLLMDLRALSTSGDAGVGDVPAVALPVPLAASRWALACVLAAIAGLVALRRLYAAGRWPPSAGLLVAGLALSAVAQHVWPRETLAPVARLYRTWRGADRPHTPPRDVGALGVRLEHPGLVNFSSVGGCQETHLIADAVFGGRPAGTALVQVGFRTRLRRPGAPDAHVVADDRRLQPTYAHVTRSRNPDPFATGDVYQPRWPALAVDCAQDVGAFLVEVFRAAPCIPEDATRTQADLSGQLSFRVVRPFVAARVPLRDGEALALGRHRVVVERVDERAIPALALSIQSLALRLLSEPGLPDYQLQVVNPSRRECISAQVGWFFGYGATNNITFRRHGRGVEFTYWPYSMGTPLRFPNPGSAERPPTWSPSREWLEGAELVVIRAEELGHVELPFELKDAPWWR